MTDHVTSASQLERAVSKGFNPIVIAGDFALDRTIYIPTNLEIQTENAHTITRAAGFSGDLFVIGEDSTGASEAVTFALGNRESQNGVLTIDGNAGNTTVPVNGSVLFVAAGSRVSLYDGLVIQNANKTGNVRALSESYQLGTASNIGGSVAIVANGTLKINGGSYLNNSVPDGYFGGVIYNAAKVNIRGGSFRNNSAGRGGVLANVRGSAVLRKAEFCNNTATSYGGAVYAAVEATDSTDNVLTIESSEFRSNCAKNGGAVTAHSNAKTEIASSLFDGNTVTGNGGALYFYTGAVENLIRESTLSGNTAGGYGGAIYISNASRLSLFSNQASANAAKNGGYLYITTTGTEVTMIGQTVSGNTASEAGPIIYGNTTKAILNINKAKYTDLNQSNLNKDYWTMAIANKLKVNEITDEVPEDEAQNSVDVSSARELEQAIEEGRKAIRVVGDFELDRTFYITGETMIYSTKAVTLKRAPTFAGDLFVVGESKTGRSALLDGSSAALTMGRPGSSVEERLTIDGNKAHMKVGVTGSAFFLCYSGKVNLYSNVSVVNCKKTGNAKTLNEKYLLPNPERIGGAVAIVANGCLNIFGGTYSGNEANEEAAELSEDEARTSTLGGVIFNYSNVNIKGGSFTNNSAGRGGVLYNYRMINLYKGVFDGNRASKYGGAVYQADSQFGELLLGRSAEQNEHEVEFLNNEAGNSGGAVYSQTKNAIVIYGNTLFKKNRAVRYNGGAICVSGTLTIKRAEFVNNSAYSKGGALYIINNDDTLTTRYVRAANTLFSGNRANRGGAVGIMAGESTYKEGGIAHFTQCSFVSNLATDTTGNGTGTDMQGGAIYAVRKSTLSAEGCTFRSNASVDEGGAIYGSGESKITLTDSAFVSNQATSTNSGNGGAISVHSCDFSATGTSFEQNSAAKSAGALYVSYVGSSERDSVVTLNGGSFDGNVSQYHGGAVYVTTHIENAQDLTLTAKGTHFVRNHSSYNGGAVYLTGARSYLEDVELSQNVADATANTSGSRYGGGAIYTTGSSLELNRATLSGNSSDYNGGAIALYSSSELIGNQITGTENRAAAYGGAIYTNKSTMNLYHSAFASNESQKGGGAIALYTDAVTNLYTTTFTGNSAAGNGGALYVYTGGTETMVRDCALENNTASGSGGGIYCSNASVLSVFCCTAKGNAAKSGGALYMTSAGTTVNLADLTVSQNTASEEGPILCGNSTKAVLNIDKSQYTDLETEQLDAAYWSGAIAGKLTVHEVSIAIPAYTDYDHTQVGPEDPEEKTPVPVEDVFSLEGSERESRINNTYDGFARLEQNSNFMSKQETAFDNVNGRRVTVDTFVYHPNDTANNPSFGEGLLVYQAMLYKKAHPDKEVSIDISSFRFSVEAAVCINRSSRYYGYMRNLGSAEYDDNGFVRVAYLLVSAAKMGVHVNVIGQMDAYPVSAKAQRFQKYFESRLNEPCDPAYVGGSVVGDYLRFTFINWTSYGDDGATDMMHTKVCAVSNYIDWNGKEHSGTIWSSSANLDGISATGTNGNNNIQTGSIVSDHDRLYQVTSNYLKLIAQYGGQEDVYEFRDRVVKLTTEQIQKIRSGKESDIDPDQQIVYLGSDTDDTFELYFSPYGGNAADWDEVNNPFCKYLRKLEQSDDYILFTWTNVKFKKNFSLCTSMEDMIVQAFHKNKNPKNRIYILLPGFNAAAFDDLVLGKDIGYKSFGVAAKGSVHSKDLQFSYSENGVRKYVTLLNSMNMHQGAMSYQSNFSLVIKETSCDEDSVFFTVADETTAGIVDHNYGEEQRHEPDGTEEGYTYVKCLKCGQEFKTGVIHNDSGEWIIDREATDVSMGLKHRQCTACGEILEAQEIEVTGHQAREARKETEVGLTIPSGEAGLYNLPDSIEDLPLTYEAEVCLPKELTGRGGVIIGNYAGSDVNSVSFEVYREGRPRIYMRDGVHGWSYSYVFDYDIRTGKRVHLAIVLDGRNVLLYINGRLQETKPITANKPKLSTELKVGGDARTGNGQYFKGTIYSVNVFSDVRTAAEVKKDCALVAPDEEDLIYSKYFAEASCPENKGGHVKGEWMVDRAPSETENGISHRVCIHCGELLEAAETTTGGELVRTMEYSAARGLNVRSNETKYVLPETIEEMPLTYEAEIYLPRRISGRGGIILGNYAGPDVNSVSFEIKTNGRPRIYFRDAANQKWYSYLFSTDIRGRKVHVTIKLDGKKAVLYVDGVKKETKTISAVRPKLSTPLCVGSDAREGNEQFFKGTIYSIHAFADVRTDEEIKQDAVLVSSNAQGLVYSKYFTGAVCSAGRTESTPHVASTWIVDEESTETKKGMKHTECMVCGEILEVSEIPVGTHAGSHIRYSTAAGLSFASPEVQHPIDGEKMTDAPRTIEADIYLPRTFPSGSRGGVVLGNFSNKNNEMSFEIYTTGRPRLYIRNGSDKSYVFSTDLRSDGKRHVAVTVENAEAKLYVDGVLKETIPIEVDVPASSSVTYVGGDGRNGNAQYFKGKIYSVHVFSDVRTAEEIAMDRIFVSDTEDNLMYGAYFN